MWSLDLETPEFRSGMQAPPPAAAGLAGDLPLFEDPHCARVRDLERDLPLWVVAAASPQFPSVVEMAARRRDVLVNHRLPFDLACLVETRPDLAPDLLGRLAAGAGACTELRERVLDAADGVHVSKNVGHYNLARVAARYAVEVGPKDEDSPRRDYARLASVPIARWPDAHVRYLALDARAPLEIFLAQEERSARTLDGRALEDSYRQVAYHAALELARVHGVRADPWAVERYYAEIRGRLERDREELLAAGYLTPKRGGGYSRRKKLFEPYVEALWSRLGMRAPRNAPTRTHREGSLKLDLETAEASGDPLFEAYARYAKSQNALGKVDELAPGREAPLHTVFDFAETGRTRSFKPALQNRRARPGDRECLVPDPGWIYALIDVDGLELRGYAQVCLRVVGWSKLAELLNSGGDPHLYLASFFPELEGVPYEELARRKRAGDPVVSNARQTAKIANFGFAGGCRIATFCAQAWAKYRVLFREDEARRLKDLWLRAFPEMREYLRWISRLTATGLATMTHLFSHRHRGRCKYTDAANTLFQGLGADATKLATLELLRACYDPASPLLGCRVEHYVHDEWLPAIPEDERVPVRVSEIERLVREGCTVFLPDVPATGEAIPARRWSKLARRVEHEGRVVPWEWRPAVRVWRAARWGSLRVERPNVFPLLERHLELDRQHDLAQHVAGELATVVENERDAEREVSADLREQLEEARDRARDLDRELVVLDALVAEARARIDRPSFLSLDGYRPPAVG